MAGDSVISLRLKCSSSVSKNIYVQFAVSSTPDKLNDRTGGYPYEALFVGFIVFEN